MPSAPHYAIANMGLIALRAYNLFEVMNIFQFSTFSSIGTLIISTLAHWHIC